MHEVFLITKNLKVILYPASERVRMLRKLVGHDLLLYHMNTYLVNCGSLRSAVVIHFR